MRKPKVFCVVGLIFGLLLAGVCSLAADKSSRKNGISSLNYHGWADSLLLNNGTVEAVIVLRCRPRHAVSFCWRG